MTQKHAAGKSIKSPGCLSTDLEQTLRQRAERQLQENPARSKKIQPGESRRLINELEVHQIELEMQNEELRRAQQELEAARAKYFELFDLAPVAYLTLNETGIVLEANLTASNLLAVERSQLSNKPVTSFIFIEDQDIYYLHRKQLFDTGAPQTCELRMLGRGAVPFWVHIEAIASQGNDDARMCRAVLSDITERKQAEAQLLAAQAETQRLLAESNQSRRSLLSVVEDHKMAEERIHQLNAELEQRVRDRTAQLQSANEELEAFAYSVSHDLRAPLRALAGFSEALLCDYAGLLDEQGKHYLKRIQEGSYRMDQLISDLLDLSRVTRKQIKLQRVDLGALARTIAAEVRARVPQRQVEFAIADRMIVQGDEHLLRILLENLMNNAVKFTEMNSQARIEIGCESCEGLQPLHDSEFIYFIKDNGVGFDMAYVDKLFVPFQRLHGTLEFPGSGLGLATVQRIVRRHGGRVWAEAAVGQGATFYFTLGIMQ